MAEQSQYCCSSLVSSLDPFFKEVTDIPDLSNEERMKYEWIRLGSYSEFPSTSCGRPMLLAEAGFYYSGHNDTVVCFSCRLAHGTWSNTDNPIEIHKQHSPSCRFICGDETRNVPITRQHNVGRISSNFASSTFTSRTLESQLLENGTTSNSQVNDAASQEVHIPKRNSSLHGAAHNSTACSSLGIVSEKPKYPRYAVLAIRLSSFDGWPIYLSQTPKELAMSGLFYAGFSDCVRCFFCGGGLRNWKAGDDPWVEHARWFSNCPFVKQCRGSEFIQKVLEVVQRQATAEAGAEDPPKALSDVTNHVGLAEASNVTTMSTPAVLSVLEMGYSSQRVQDAVGCICEENGQVTAENIMTMIFKQDEMENKLSSEKKLANHMESQIFKPQKSVKLTEDDMHDKSQIVTEAQKSLLLAEIQEMKDQSLCKICMDEQCCIVFLPCGHMVACAMCAPALRTCPICRKFVNGTIRAYIP